MGDVLTEFDIWHGVVLAVYELGYSVSEFENGRADAGRWGGSGFRRGGAFLGNGCVIVRINHWVSQSAIVIYQDGDTHLNWAEVAQCSG